jgi:uncharacterized protein
MIEEIKKTVLNLCENNDWKWDIHVKSVVENSKMLAKQFNADVEICEISAWLHDISQVRDCIKKDHHLKSANEAVQILEKFSYNSRKIEKVKQCILTHSQGSKDLPKSLEAKIIMVADALSHFDQFLRLFYIAFTIKKMSIEEAKNWLTKKYENCWNKLEMIPKSKNIAKKKYEIIKIILREKI